MKKINIFIIIFIILFIFIFIYFYFNQKKEGREIFMESKNNKIINLNVKEGQVLENDFDLSGYFSDISYFDFNNNEILYAILTDNKGNMLGKKYLKYYLKDNKLFFEGELSYNQTYTNNAILEIKTTPKKNQEKIYSFRLNVKLNNKPAYLNKDFIPSDGSAFVSQPIFEPKI